jgi:hypothetical protein
MEHALHVARPDDLHLLAARHARLYVGDDLCARLLPERDAARALVAAARARRLPLTLLTPVAPSEALPLIARLAHDLAESGLLDEAVVNDYGVLALLAREAPGLRLAVGRALAFTTGVPTAAELRHFGVVRLEHDSLAAVNRDAAAAAAAGLSLSLYGPLTVVSASRYCPARLDAGTDAGWGIRPCRRECLEQEPLLVRPHRRVARGEPQPLLRDQRLVGNALFVELPASTADAAAAGVDRLVWQPVRDRGGHAACPW